MDVITIAPIKGKAFLSLFRIERIYNRARPAAPTAPMSHEAALTCDAAPVGDEAAALPEELGVPLDVPLGLPDMPCWETAMPVLFLQWLS
jgi:hypothetical protein